MATAKTQRAKRPVRKFAPAVFIPVVKIPQPDGSILIRPGRLMVTDDEIGITEAAQILGLSTRTIQHQCELGEFVTAHKPSGRRRGMWKIARSEVFTRISNHNAE